MLPAHADVAKAKELLTQAGYPDGLKIEMTLGTTWKTLSDQGPLIKDMLGRAGIDVTLTPMENPRYMDSAGQRVSSRSRKMTGSRRSPIRMISLTSTTAAAAA